MASYRFVCAHSATCAAGHPHMRAVGFVVAADVVHLPGMEVAAALRDGDWFYCQDGGGEHLLLRVGCCSCGEERLSARLRPDGSDPTLSITGCF